MKTVYRQCTLCEAHCGIRVEVEGTTRVLRITGDPDDVMSGGYICPKAAALVDLHEDPDRLRHPVKHVGDEWVAIPWPEALDFAAAGLRAIQDRHGANTVATYLGNPGAHSAALLPAVALRALLGSENNYSAVSVDQLPQHRSSHEMFGSLALLPIPDVDRTDHMLLLGANPAVSNGSVMTAPGARHRLQRSGSAADESSSTRAGPRRSPTPASTSRSGPAETSFSCSACSTRSFGRTWADSPAASTACPNWLALPRTGRPRGRLPAQAWQPTRSAGWPTSSPPPPPRSPTAGSGCVTSAPAPSPTG